MRELPSLFFLELSRTLLELSHEFRRRPKVMGLITLVAVTLAIVVPLLTVVHP